MNTPEQAKELWCPMVRMRDGSNVDHGGRVMCIADKCAMWRWEHTTASVPTETNGARTYEQRTVKTHGYCGLAPLHQ